ncbi:MAG: cytochrome C, partial [Nitrospirae bacterium]|nr:cytochrome C [Nitrospirota bacterium]
MRSHVFRPLWIALGLFAFLLTARALYVPGDFGVHRGDYTYGWYRAGDEEDWKAVPVKHQGREYCEACHPENYAKITASKHARIQCENCHGPARDHPADPPKLHINRERDL